MRSSAEQSGRFIVANGQDIPNFGRATLQTVDEYRNEHNVMCFVIDVQKPLGSASDVSKHHDAVIFDELGPSTVPIWSLRQQGQATQQQQCRDRETPGNRL